MTIHSTDLRPILDLFPVRSIASVSGVVISKSGGFSVILLLVETEVSPCLTSAVRPAARVTSITRRKISRFRARSGVIYKALMPGPRFSFEASETIIGTKAASVFPDPVGATRSEFLLRRMTGYALLCIGVSRFHPSLLNRSET